MVFYSTEARISKDPIVGLIQEASNDKDPTKLLAIVGAAHADDGKLLVPDAVNEAAREISINGLDMTYCPTPGIPELGALLSEEILGKKTLSILESKHIHKAEIVTAGGTNAISIALSALCNKDDVIISHNPHWAGYDSVALGTERKAIVNFEILDKDANFNIQSFKDTLGFSCEKYPHSKIVLLLNTPFDNPLGKNYGETAWEQMAQAIYRQRLTDIERGLPEREIIMIIDTAYLDYGPGGKDYSRLSFLPKFLLSVNGPETNKDKFNIVIAGTVSKSFAMYGARVGVATLLTANIDHANLWRDTVGGVIRGTFSNASRTGQEIALKVLKDMAKLANVHEFQKQVSDLIVERSQVFMQALGAGADAPIMPIANGLEIIRPDGGFFVSLRIEDRQFARKLFDACLEEHFYVPLISSKYLRIPTCGLSSNKLEAVAKRILEISNRIKTGVS